MVKYKIISNTGISLQILRSSPCYLAISIANPYTQRGEHSNILKWVSENFDSCEIIIGDYLYRINEFITFGRNSKDAEEKSQLLGKLIEQQLQYDIKQCERQIFRITHWAELLKDEFGFRTSLAKLKRFEKSNSLFHDSLKNISTSYVLKQREKGLLYIDVEEYQAIEMSMEYLLEELAVFECLAESGNKTHIYPGTILPTLKQIVNGKYPDMSTEMNKITLIELKSK